MWFVSLISAFRPLFSVKRRSVPKLLWVKNSLITFSEHDIGAQILRNSHPPGLEVLCKKGVLRNFVKCTGKQGLFIIKENLPQVFCCELFEISMKIFFDRTLPVAASELLNHSD